MYGIELQFFILTGFMWRRKTLVLLLLLLLFVYLYFLLYTICSKVFGPSLHLPHMIGHRIFILQDLVHAISFWIWCLLHIQSSPWLQSRRKMEHYFNDCDWFKWPDTHGTEVQNESIVLVKHNWFIRERQNACLLMIWLRDIWKRLRTSKK